MVRHILALALERYLRRGYRLCFRGSKKISRRSKCRSKANVSMRDLRIRSVTAEMRLNAPPYICLQRAVHRVKNGSLHFYLLLSTTLFLLFDFVSFFSFSFLFSAVPVKIKCECLTFWSRTNVAVRLTVLGSKTFFFSYRCRTVSFIFHRIGTYSYAMLMPGFFELFFFFLFLLLLFVFFTIHFFVFIF